MPMPSYDFTAPRLSVSGSLVQGARVELDGAQANYLLNVLRLRTAASILAFNGQDGEWRAELVSERRGQAALVCVERTRPQPPAPDLHYCFALLKHSRLDYMVQKAVEMGASVLQPVLTRRTQASRVNGERMRANVVEAAEQCGILNLPVVRSETRLDRLLADWPADRLMVFCDEEAPVADPIAALRQVVGAATVPPLAVAIGPEGGFDPDEREALRALPRVVSLSLGPRILRADTAAVAALAVVQAVLGDWSTRPPY